MVKTCNYYGPKNHFIINHFIWIDNSTNCYSILYALQKRYQTYPKKQKKDITGIKFN